MSRCFPFPPPGYEKKPTTDDADLLKKEKHKEKKHKKDKKDKEKKEGKEKREKDRSDGKNREKKDRKEKHREKKDKEKDKDKDNSSISEEKRVGGQLEGYNGEKLHPKEELDKEKKSSSNEKKAAIQVFHQQEKKPVQSSILVKETEDPKFVQELGQRIRDDEKGAGSSQLVERFYVVERKKDDPAGRSTIGDIGMVSEGKIKDKKADNKKMDVQRIRDEASFAGLAKNKLEGPTLLPSDKKTDKKIEEKNKSRDKDNDDKRGDKRKKKDREKKSQGKERDGEKEKKKEEKTKGKNEHKRTEKIKTKHSSKGEIVCAPNDNKSTHLPKDSAGIAASERNLKKRKAAETNGFSHDDEPEARPNKMPRPASNLSTQNGRKLEPYQSPGLLPSDKQRLVASLNNLKVDNKEQKINGIITAPTPAPASASAPVPPLLSVPKPKPSSSSTVVSVSTAKPSSATANDLSAPVTSVSTLKPPNVTANEISASKKATVLTSRKPSSTTNNQVVKASSMKMKPPHPDSKFLNQILTVPKMEEVPDLDDQEWLFSSKDRLLKKPDMDSEPQVWAEALRLESVDIFALPYVVPY